MKTSKSKQSKYYILGILILAILAILIIPNLIVSTLENITQSNGMKLSTPVGQAPKEPVEVKTSGSVARKWWL